MKLFKISFVVLMVVGIASCGLFKGGHQSTSAVVAAKSSNGVFSPGSAELQAIREKYRDVNKNTLAEGYTLYTGKCTACHEAKSIYSRPESEWQGIIDDMAPRAELSPMQKDAVYKYVLSIKATQPK